MLIQGLLQSRSTARAGDSGAASGQQSGRPNLQPSKWILIRSNIFSAVSAERLPDEFIKATVLVYLSRDTFSFKKYWICPLKPLWAHMTPAAKVIKVLLRLGVVAGAVRLGRVP